MVNFDEYKDGKVVSNIMKFELALSKIPILNFNDTSIEFPNMIIFTKEDKGILYSFLNPGTQILKVDADEFEAMLKNIKENTKDTVFIDRGVKPELTARINLKVMKEKMIFMKEYENSFSTNETLFTTNVAEFHGAGMFTSRRHVFLVSEEEFVKIKNYLKN